MPTQRTDKQISDIMRRVKSEDTTPEVKFRKALWARGVRYRMHDARLPGKPDLVIPKARLAVFIDGDFWHGNQWRARGHPSLEAQFVASPKANYWIGKITGNMRRDRRNTARLLASGWRVLRLWESDIAADLKRCAELTIRAIEEPEETPWLARLPNQAAAEFFAGEGLMRNGMERAGWTIVFATDDDPQEREIYLRQFPDSEQPYFLGDIESVPSGMIPTVTLATALLSNGNNPEQEWDNLSGVVYILREMGQRRPPMLLLELDTAAIEHKNVKDLLDFLYAISMLGYSCDAFILNPAHFRVDDKAKLYIFAVISDLLDSCISETSAAYQPGVRPQSLISFMHKYPQIRWHITPLPNPTLQAINQSETSAETTRASVIQWIAEMLLNPMITALIHGKPLNTKTQ